MKIKDIFIFDRLFWHIVKEAILDEWEGFKQSIMEMRRDEEKMRELTKEEIYINTPEGRKEFLKGKRICLACCFCEKPIEEKEIKIVTLTFERNGQQFWAHENCVKKNMRKEMRGEIYDKKES